MASTVLISAVGLNPQPNALMQDGGSLDVASNVIIRRENTIESRRGFKVFGNSMGTSSDRPSQLLSYKDLILRHYGSTLQYQTTVGGEVFSSFAGSYEQVSPGLRIKGVEASGNFYFTTADGIKKISAKTAGGLSASAGYITDAGGVKALDTNAYLNVTLGSNGGFLPGDSAVAYRIVWGIKDANDDLILGTPSQRAEVYNPLSGLIAQDLNNVLHELDNVGYANTGSLSGTNYLSTYGVSYSADGSTLKTQVIALASALDNDILLNSGNATISGEVFTGGLTAQVIVTSTVATTIATGDHITLSGFTAPTLTQLNGQHFTVTSISGGTTLNLSLYPITATALTPTAPAVGDVGGVINSYNYQYITLEAGAEFPALGPLDISTPATHDQLATIHETVERYIARLQAELTGVISAATLVPFIDPLAITTTANVILDFTIPDDVTTSHFYQIYRSSIVEATDQTVLSDLTPSDELQLVYEAFPTTQELIDQKVTVEDVTPDQFRGANLYTNASTGEGILQANDVPPAAKDINNFKNYTFYANTRTRHRFSLSMLGVQKLIDDTDAGITPTLTISTGTGSETFKFILGVQEVNTIVASAGTSLSGQYFTINSANDIREYYVWYNIGPLSFATTDVNIIANTITYSSHGFTNGNRVQLSSSGTLPSPLNAGTTYFIVGAALNTFQLSLTVGGAAIDLTTVGTGTHSVSSADPEVSGKIGIVVNIKTTDADTVIASKTKDALNAANIDFSATVATATVTSTNIDEGIATDIFSKAAFATTDVDTGTDTITLASHVFIDNEIVQFSSTGTLPAGISASTNYYIRNPSSTGFQISTTRNGSVLDITTQGTGTHSVFTINFVTSVTQQGQGDDSALNEVLLSQLASVARAVDTTARSLVRVINRSSSSVYAYYLSGATDVPGKMLLESRNLTDTDNPFYVVANNTNTGSSFNPILSPESFVNAGPSILFDAPAPGQVTINSTGHGLASGDQIILSGTYNASPSIDIDGIYTITRDSLDPTNAFWITATLVANSMVVANSIGFSYLSEAEVSNNEVKPNRVYYSKLQQPEAVPLVNSIDVGAEDKAILRIFPLRDSLFVFKEDGLYRISGESAPFTLSLFDASCTLIAADSLGVLNNVIFGWTRKGIDNITESGVQTISRPIDILILPKSSSQYTNFSTATWGVGYESDNAYLVYTVVNTGDTVATIAYRFSNLTNSWTTFAKTNTCGLVGVDDRLYLGAGDVNYIEQERKNFDRTDYADREYTKSLVSNSVNGNVLQFTDVSGFEVGDVITQEQYLTVYEFNALLQKLDFDPGVSETDFYSTLAIDSGDNLRDALDALATKLDADFGLTFSDYANRITAGAGPYSLDITNISVASPTVVTTDGPHFLYSIASGGRLINIVDTDTNASTIGQFEITRIDNNQTFLPADVNIGTNVITVANHGLVNGRSVMYSSTGTLPIGLTANTTYYIVSATTNTFQNALTPGGVALDIATTGTGIHTVSVTDQFSIPANVISVTDGVGSFTRLEQEFADIRTCYNILITRLNEDTGATFNNYSLNDTTTLQEVVITAVNKITKRVTVNAALQFVVGPLTLYKKIITTFTYSPITMDDPLAFKQIREATVMFDNKAFTGATVSFATDLLPAFIDVAFNSDGNGIFGMSGFFGQGFFGGAANSAPFRTYVPGPCQRCRYMILKYTHKVAREQWSILGITLTGETALSPRAYK